MFANEKKLQPNDRIIVGKHGKAIISIHLKRKTYGTNGISQQYALFCRSQVQTENSITRKIREGGRGSEPLLNIHGYHTLRTLGVII